MHLPWRRPKSYSVLREGGKRILIIGDSTAYGMGADRPEDSIAGRLGHDFPRTEIVNTAVNGSVTKNGIDQLRRAGEKPFDLILIFTGANDIWHFTRLSALERDFRNLLEEAGKKSSHRVIVLFYANLGAAPIFPGPIRGLLGGRTELVHDVFVRVTSSLEIPLVELYTGKEKDSFRSNPFFDNPETYYARDRMHPNSEGYRLWYNRMWAEMVARNLTFKE
uniref:SGNH hydrolase subfamily protein n=1 Tax=uncultured bacterium CSLC2 TaxID=1091571 RepID=Q8KP09_9BACT|nr:SGNH hydrolase subfamily protein [uncultured bacterium CSLC2]